MAMAQKSGKVNFLNEPVWKCVVAQAIPLTIAQLVHLLYNVVDRIYLGHMGGGNSMALTGVRLTFPVVSLIMAFTALFGVGGIPLFSIERGAGNEEKAGKIMGNSFALLRKAIIVVPLTLLPRWGLGMLGVFLAEPVSNVIGGLASYITMRLTVYKSVEKAIKEM